jgi:hypothetical protein
MVMKSYQGRGTSLPFRDVATSPSVPRNGNNCIKTVSAGDADPGALH